MAESRTPRRDGGRTGRGQCFWRWGVWPQVMGDMPADASDTDGGRDGDGSGWGGAMVLDTVLGLLSVVFAVIAGATLAQALGGTPGEYVVPAVFAAASIGCMYLRRRY